MTMIVAEEVVELSHGVKKLKGALKNAARLCGALELEDGQRQKLEESRKALLEALPDPPKRLPLPEEAVYAARVGIRLRHRELKSLVQRETAVGVEANDDARTRIETCEALGRKVGIQLDLIEHSDDEEDEEQPELSGVEG